MSPSFESAIVRLKTVDDTVAGAGFLVIKQQVLTCAHVVADAGVYCRDRRDRMAGLYAPCYALAAALVGYAVCDPNWLEENKRPRLLAPALEES